MPSSYLDKHEGKVFLKNNLGIKDPQTLKMIEYQYTSIKIDELKNGVVKIKSKEFNLDRAKEIHKHLLGEIYPWAGKERTVGLSKAIPNTNPTITSNFSPPDLIPHLYDKANDISKELSNNKNYTFDQKVEKLSEAFFYANLAHPFREGNGRTNELFIAQMGKEHGVDLNFDKVHGSKEWNLASAKATILIIDDPKEVKKIPPDLTDIKKQFDGIAKPMDKKKEMVTEFEQMGLNANLKRFPELKESVDFMNKWKQYQETKNFTSNQLTDKYTQQISALIKDGKYENIAKSLKDTNTKEQKTPEIQPKKGIDR